MKEEEEVCLARFSFDSEFCWSIFIIFIGIWNLEKKIRSLNFVLLDPVDPVY